MTGTETPTRPASQVGASNAYLSGPRDENKAYSSAPSPLSDTPDPTQFWEALTLPDDRPMASCLLPPSVMREAARQSDRPGPYRRALRWAYYLGWSDANLHALATWLVAAWPSCGWDGSPADEVAKVIEWVRGDGALDERNEPEKPPKLDDDEVIEMLSETRRMASESSWSGATAGTDRALFLAICDEALGAKAPWIRLQFSERRGEALGIASRLTIRAGLKRLRERGVLRSICSAAFPRAARYEIRWPWRVPYLAQCQSKRTCTSTQVTGTGQVLAPSLAWGHSVLGRSCQRLVECLAWSEPSTGQAWFEAAGVPRRTFYRVKPVLLDPAFPLVEQDAAGVYRPVPDLQERLQIIVESSGAVDRHKRRVQRHALDREGLLRHRLWVAGLDERFECVVTREADADPVVDLIDTKTRKVVPPAVAFSVENLEESTPPGERSWQCPLIPYRRWRPRWALGETPVSVRSRSAHRQAVAA